MVKPLIIGVIHSSLKGGELIIITDSKPSPLVSELPSKMVLAICGLETT
jgi:uncharacterized protein (DUF2249 family)